MYDGSRILTLLDVRSGLILLEATGIAVLLPKLPALHIPSTNRDQVSRVLTNPLALSSIGVALCCFRCDGSIHQLDLT
jgi:hypothetical protein